MRVSIENKIRAGFGLAAAFLLLTGLLAWWSAHRNAETFREVDHTYAVLDQIQATLVDMLNTETGTRGFAISGDEALLEPYQAGLASVEKSFAELRRLTQDKPSQQRQLADMEPVIQRELRYQTQVIQRRRSGDINGVQQLVASGQGKQAMDEIRRLIGEMNAEEVHLLQQRSARAQALARAVIVIVMVGSLLAVVLVSLAGGIVRRDFQKRQQAEAERDRFVTIALDLFCIASSDGYFKRLNPAFTQTLGWSVEEMLARPFLDFVHPDDRAATLAVVEKQVARGEKVLHSENRYQHKDGAWRVLSWKSAPYPGGLMYATGRDVTDLKRVSVEKSWVRSIQRPPDNGDDSAAGTTLRELSANNARQAGRRRAFMLAGYTGHTGLNNPANLRP